MSAIRCLFMAALLCGCAMHREARLYDALGQETGITRLVDALVVELHSDARIGTLFEETDDAYFKARLIEQICQISDGDCEYTGLDMVEAHSGMDLSEAQFNDFVDIARRVMSRIGIRIGVQNRLLARLASMREDIIHQ